MPRDVRPSGGPQASPSLRPRLGLLAGLVLFPLLLALPAPGELSPAGWRTAAVGLLMALWWMTEAVPIAVTALLPIVLFPVLGVAPVGDATAPYAHPLIFLFLGGFLLALGLQRWGLHRRIALTIIRAVGSRPRRILLGFMTASAFLSMWISNTATAMMMLPIGLSVIELGAPAGPRASSLAEGRDGGAGDAVRRGEPFALGLMLAIAYAASIGGMGTIIGSPPNALLVAFLDESLGVQLSFVAWMAVGVPVGAVGLAAAYPLLTRVIFPLSGDGPAGPLSGGASFLREELRALGPMSRQERAVAAIFGLTALLWVTRPLVERRLPGISDTGIALFGALLLFLVPADRRRGRFLLAWSEARKLPWGVLLLFGGGLSLAAAVSDTGLAGWIGDRLRGVGGLPSAVIVLAVVATVILLTELTSNTATTATFLPVVASLAAAVGQDPLGLLLPTTLAASCAFMMPVATPPNAIVYGSGYVTIPWMVRAGVWLNLLFTGLLTLAAFTIVPWAMELAIENS